MIYNQIEASGKSGVWKRLIGRVNNFHENVVTKGLKDLMGKGMIKEIRSAKMPSKRMLMLSFLEPSEEHTGGTFFTEGEMDEGLIEVVCSYVVKQIEFLSWAEQDGPPVAKSKRRKHRTSTVAVSDEEGTKGERPLFMTPTGPHGRALVPHPPGYRDYPTVKDVVKIIEDGEILKGVHLKEPDVKLIIRRLEFDGRLERMFLKHKNAIGYRTTRQTWERHRLPGQESSDWYGPLDPDGSTFFGPGDDFTQTPCSRCPLFSSCRPGGLVSPETCVYMEEWLSF
jgi:DNA-directed RNA polymerase III subunit RPC6